MILIAESGSTKTDWRSIDSKIQFTTQGIHPLFVDEANLIDELLQQFKILGKEIVQKIYFYGSGCGTQERSKIVYKLLSQFFVKANIEVHSDLEAAARALFKNKEGVVCILGTGSNSGYYNGKVIKESATSLGYILGDEGSGSHIGKQIISNFLKREFEPKLQKKLETHISMDTSEIIDQIYCGDYPNRFLASFAPLANKYLHFKGMKNVCRKSFEVFFKQSILKLNIDSSIVVSFVGSVAFYFQDVIKEVANDYSINIGRFVEKPIDLLLEYHQENRLID